MIGLAELDGLETQVKARHQRELDAIETLRAVVAGKVWRGPLSPQGDSGPSLSSDAVTAAQPRLKVRKTVVKGKVPKVKKNGVRTAIPATQYAREWIAKQGGAVFSVGNLGTGVAQASGLSEKSLKGRLSVFVSFLKERGEVEAASGERSGEYRATPLFGKVGRAAKAAPTPVASDRWAMREKIAAELAAKKGSGE